jgi:hypothetical protein
MAASAGIGVFTRSAFCWNAMSAGRIAATIAAGARSGPSVLRSRWIARACSCDTRDSLTPISAPICFIVASPK